MAFGNDQSPSGGRIHWLDLLLGLALFVLVVRTVVQAWPRFDQKERKTVRLEVVVDGLAAAQAAQIAVGQWVKDGTTGEYMGKIIRKATASGAGGAEHPLAEARTERHEAQEDLVLVLEREGKIVAREGIFFGRETVRSGQERRFHTFYTEFTGTINRVAVVQE